MKEHNTIFLKMTVGIFLDFLFSTVSGATLLQSELFQLLLLTAGVLFCDSAARCEFMQA